MSVRISHLVDREGFEVFVIDQGKVINRQGFPFKNTRMGMTSNAAHWTTWTNVNLKNPPAVGSPLSVEIAGPGLDDGPYRFSISRMP